MYSRNFQKPTGVLDPLHQVLYWHSWGMLALLVPGGKREDPVWLEKGNGLYHVPSPSFRALVVFQEWHLEVSRDPEMQTLALVCAENSEGMEASFPQCKVSLVSSSQGHFVITSLSSSFLSDSPFDLISILPALLSPFAWPALLASFLCYLLLLTVPSPVLSSTDCLLPSCVHHIRPLLS